MCGSASVSENVSVTTDLLPLSVALVLGLCHHQHLCGCISSHLPLYSHADHLVALPDLLAPALPSLPLPLARSLSLPAFYAQLLRSCFAALGHAGGRSRGGQEGGAGRVAALAAGASVGSDAGIVVVGRVLQRLCKRGHAGIVAEVRPRPHCGSRVVFQADVTPSSDVAKNRLGVTFRIRCCRELSHPEQSHGWLCDQ